MFARGFHNPASKTRMNTLLACVATLSCLAACVAEENVLIDEAPSPAPGTKERCNKLQVCLPYSSRIQYSFDFLCCEDGYGWPAAHVLNPLGLSIFFGNFWFAWFGAFVFEAFEVGTLALFGDFVVFETAQLELETWAGSVIGDALIQGAIGATLGLLLRWLWGISGPFQSWDLFSFWQRIKWLALWFAYALSFITLSYAGDAGNGNTLNYGLFVALAIHTVLLLVVYPLTTRSARDERTVWQQYATYLVTYKQETPDKRLVCLTGTAHISLGPVPFWRRYALFASWWVVNVAIGLQSTGYWKWQPNDWYQVWLVAAIILAILAAATFVRPSWKKTPAPYTLKVVLQPTAKRRVRKLVD